MASGEVAALVTAIGISLAAIITSIAALMNARNSKDVAERLRDEIGALQAHNVDQDSLLFNREIELNRLKKENVSLTLKIVQWQTWGQTIGREMNEMKLIVGYLTSRHDENSKSDDTHILPGL